MKIHTFSFHFLFIFFLAYLSLLSATKSPLVSTESDPDAFIQNCVNVINGDYCEAVTDLVVTGPDALILQRYYSSRDSITGKEPGGWRIFPERFLVIGKDSPKKTCTVDGDTFEWTSAFTGERSGGILPYNGWRNTNGMTKEPLEIDAWNCALGMVNTYSKEMNGQTNHKNNRLHCNGDICELTLGDGSKRIYEKVQSLPSLLFGEEMIPLMAAQMSEADYFILVQEILPSGNQLFFSYDQNGHLTAIEMKNSLSNKSLSWIHFSYEFKEKGCRVHIEASDARELNYDFIIDSGHYQLTQASGSHCTPISYEYKEVLTRKNLSEGRFLEIEYQGGKVAALKRPNAQSGKKEAMYSFSYGKNYTDVFDTAGIKTRYLYDMRFQLQTIERYDHENNLYRTENKFWGKNEFEAGNLLAKTIGDGKKIYSYRSFQYDKNNNITEERLYGNLTGKQDVSLQVSLCLLH